jgi:ApaG protein
MSFQPDIEIEVSTQYLKSDSRPLESRFVFSYTITITNHGNEPIKLLNRRWHICDANEKVQDVEGEGVIGQQPRLIEGESFQYTSGAILETPAGTMEGAYEFITDSGTLFEAPIPAFSLVDPSSLH